jgi:hypothetical protein
VEASRRLLWGTPRHVCHRGAARRLARPPHWPALWLLALVALAACESPLEPLPEDTPRTASLQFVHEGVLVELQTSLSSLYLRPGDSVAVTTTVRNVGDENVTFRFNHGCPFQFSVVDSGGKVVVGGSFSCFILTYSLTLAPSEELSRTRHWYGHLDGGGGNRFARPGIYDVHGAFNWRGPPVPLEVRRPRPF